MAVLLKRASAQDSDDGQTLVYRGFSADVSALRGDMNRAAMVASLRHQIDIAADCGAKPQILTFFRSQKITLKVGAGDGGGSFNGNFQGVMLDAAVQPPEKPVLLHELLHAFHYRFLPGGFRNPEVLRFYQLAIAYHRYKPGSYVLTNVKEFFAVTASLYLWGQVDRPPYNRARLQSDQPNYYVWLGQLFGIEK
jgi:hypothetical protein